MFVNFNLEVAPDYGQGQMKELNSLLKDIFCNFDLNINARKGFLEVKTKIDPKLLLHKIMEKLWLVSPIDFIFTFGNEERYRDVFDFLENKKNYSRYWSPQCTSVSLTHKNQQFIQSVLMKFLEE